MPGAAVEAYQRAVGVAEGIILENESVVALVRDGPVLGIDGGMTHRYCFDHHVGSPRAQPVVTGGHLHRSSTRVICQNDLALLIHAEFTASRAGLHLNERLAVQEHLLA